LSRGAEKTRRGARTLAASDIYAHSFEQPRAVEPKDLEIFASGATIVHRLLPPCH
jgi:hypothetical protein